MTRRALVLLVALVAGLLALDVAPASAAEHSVFAYGDAAFHGSTGTVRLNHAVVGMARTPSGDGYWLAARDGRVTPFGAAGMLGSATVPAPLTDPVVAIASTPTGRGYWLATSSGAVYTFGDAAFLGSLGSTRLAEPIVGMARTPSGRGYWLVARDGGIFTFGDAAYLGSTGNIGLNEPIAGMARTPSGRGYWLVARDGGIFTFGDARFVGSTGAIRLQRSIVGMATTASGKGYWLVAGDGGIFAFGDASYLGSAGGGGLSEPAVGIVASPTGAGYWIATTGHVSSSPSANPPQRLIHPGSYRVGHDSSLVAPGTYRATGATPTCHWERWDSNGVSALVTSNDRQIVTIREGDTLFRTSGCSPFTNELMPLRGDATATFGDGSWIVGIDVAPGTWIAPGGNECEWQRVSDFSGAPDAQLATDGATTRPVVVIQPGDRGFITDDCGQWVRQ